MCHNTEEWGKIWGGTGLFFEKWHEEFGEIWPNTWKSHNVHFNVLFLTKSRGVICHDTEGWCNIQRKIDWWFEKRHKKFG